MTVPDRRTTRRQALGLGAAAFTASALRSPATALAGRPALFELALDAEPLTASAAGAGWRTTRVLRAPRRFDLVGLRWARGSRAEAQVRARRRGGEWTGWAALHVLGDHGPDGAQTLAGTDPAFVGAADELQLRLRGNPRALRARFVRALPTATVARRLGERLRRRARTSARRQVSGPPVRVITRSEWGGDSVPPRAAADYGAVEVAFVHHTVTTNDYGPEDSAAIVLGIARYHRDSNGWNDLGYNFLVDKYGQVFEGRAGGIDAPVIGAQAQGYNSVSTGIACLGTFTEIAQSEPGMEALARLIGWKLTLHGVPVQGQVTVTSAGGSSNRYRSGTPVTLERISRPPRRRLDVVPRRRALRPARRPARPRGALHRPAGGAHDVHVEDRARREAVRGRRRAALLRRLLARRRWASTSRSRPAAPPGPATPAPSSTRTEAGSRASRSPTAPTCARSSPATPRAGGWSPRPSRSSSCPACASRSAPRGPAGAGRCAWTAP